MARPYQDLRNRMAPVSRARAEARGQRELLTMNLGEIARGVGQLTQAQVLDWLEKSQATVSALEKREDMLLSSLADYVRALGGELELVARFPGRDIRITQFDDVRGQIGGR